MDRPAFAIERNFTAGELAGQFDTTYQMQMRVRLLAKANGDQVEYDNPFNDGSDVAEVAGLADEMAATHVDEFAAARELIGRGQYETVDALDFIRDRCIPPAAEDNRGGMVIALALAAGSGAFMGAAAAALLFHFI